MAQVAKEGNGVKSREFGIFGPGHFIRTITGFFFLLILCFPPCTNAQIPFSCKGHYYLVQNEVGGSKFYRIRYDENTAFADANLLFVTPGYNNINAIGFRITDNFIYGLNASDNTLVRIGADASVTPLATLVGVPNQAGAITPDGRYLVLVRIDGEEMVIVDLNAPDYDFTTVPITPINSGVTFFLTDVAFFPETNILYAFDENSQSLITIDIETGILDNISFSSVDHMDHIPAIFFNQKGDLLGVGVDNLSGGATRFYTFNLPINELTKANEFSDINGSMDGCSCPFGLRLLKTVNPREIRPCMDVFYTFTIINYTNRTQSGIQLFDALPPGLNYRRTLYNGYGVNTQFNLGNQLLLDNFDVPIRTDSIVIQFELAPDVEGSFPNQAKLKQPIPDDPDLNLEVFSDDPNTIAFQDPTYVDFLPAEDGFDFCADKLRKVYAPTAFSPNEDQINDIFYLQSANELTINNLSIYNRWGVEVFTTANALTNDPAFGWSGRDDSGNVLPNGVYAWQANITFLDGKTFLFSGSILLGR
jgi:gliding motility-associated-like protein/uncharacterized repeat protein (TIGR01451 family)